MAGGGLNTLDAIETKLDKLLAKVKQVDSLLGRASGTLPGVPGSGNSVMPTSQATFSTPLPGGVQKVFNTMGGIFKLGAGFATGAAQMMPDVGATVTRESGYYGAGVATGALISRAQLQRQTRLGLGAFTTSAGSDAAVAAILASRGVVPGSADYLRTVAGVAGAARYLNMPNEVAAMSISQTTMGQASSSFMRSFGIFTANPQTGEKFSEAQVFEQIYRRATAGRGKANVQDTLESLNRGFLGETVRNMTMLDDAGKARLAQYFIDKASGITVDLANPESLDAAITRNKEQGYENPFLSAYRLSSKETENMEAATQPYIKGIKAATDELIKLKDFTRTELLPTFGEFNAAMQTFLGDRTGQGVVAPVTGAVGAAGNFLSTFLATAAGATIATKGGAILSKVAGTAGTLLPRLAPVAAPLVSAYTGFHSGSTKKGFDWGELLLSMGGSAAVGGLVGGGLPGALIGGLVGGASYVGGRLLGGMFAPEGGQGGSSSAFGQAGFSGATGAVTAPLSGGRISSQYGAERAGGRIHKGVDIAMPEGTPVYAVAGGRVIKSQMSTATTFSYGNFVEIQHSAEFSTLYAHLSERLVAVGQEVSAGQMIGKVGSTGLSSGPHLHLEVRKNGVQINPNFILPEDLGGQGKDYSAANNGGQKEAGKTSKSGKKSASLLDLAVNPSSGVGTMSSVSVSAAGVKGRSYRTSQVVASSFGTSTRGLSSPAYAALGSDAIGGAENYLPLSGSTLGIMNSRNSNPAANVLTATKNQVTINLSIAKASEEEAKKFAGWLKDYLEEEKLTDRMGAF